MSLYGVGRTDTGQVRSSNQDTHAIDNDCQLWIVADGMGGHAGGDVASRMAVDSVLESLRARSVAQQPGNTSSALTLFDVEQAIKSANDTIITHAHHNPALTGMGTTLVLICMPWGSKDQVVIGHVGDSRAYLLRGDTIIQLTTDHTLVQELIQQGLLSPEQALNHPLTHILNRAIGIETVVSPDLTTLHLLPKDRLLLCSDGLTKMLSDHRILEILRQPVKRLDDSCDALVQEANRLGGEDNITVVLLERQIVNAGKSQSEKSGRV